MKKIFIILLTVFNVFMNPQMKKALAHSLEAQKSRSHTEAEIYGYSGRKSKIHQVGDDNDWLLKDIIGDMPQSEDYGYFRFGKRQPQKQYGDYGHLRLGRNGGGTN